MLAAFDPAAFLTDESGRVVAVNRRFRDLVGIDEVAAAGEEPPYSWWPEDQHRWFTAQLGDRLESAAERTKFEGNHVSRDGHRVPGDWLVVASGAG